MLRSLFKFAKPCIAWLCKYYANLIKNFEKMDLRFLKDYGLSSIPGFPETSLLGILARSLLSFQDKPLILLDLVRLR